MDSPTPFRIRKAARRDVGQARRRAAAPALAAALLAAAASLAACGGTGAGPDGTDPPAREIGRSTPW